MILEFLVAVGVPAGTEIRNVAHLHYSIESKDFNISSNVLVDIVDQKLDMQMSCAESDVVMVGVGETKRVLHFMLKNTGNGEDNYSFLPVEATSVDFSVLNPKVYVDNGDGVFSLTEDTLATEITVASDGNVSLFLVSDIPNDALISLKMELKLFQLFKVRSLMVNRRKQITTTLSLQRKKKPVLIFVPMKFHHWLWLWRRQLSYRVIKSIKVQPLNIKLM